MCVTWEDRNGDAALSCSVTGVLMAPAGSRLALAFYFHLEKRKEKKKERKRRRLRPAIQFSESGPRDAARQEKEKRHWNLFLYWCGDGNKSGQCFWRWRYNRISSVFIVVCSWLKNNCFSFYRLIYLLLFLRSFMFHNLLSANIPGVLPAETTCSDNKMESHLIQVRRAAESENPQY